MVTKTQPKRQVVVRTSEVTLSSHDQATLGQLLGVGSRDRAALLDRLREQLAEHQASLRGAPLMPTRANHIAAFSEVQKDAARLYQTITKLPEHHRTVLPGVSTFVDQLAKFHDDVQIGLIQMRGRGTGRGGAKKQAIAGARKTVEHALGVFFDLNARSPDGTLRTEGLTAPTFSQERLHFIEYCMDLIA